MGTENDGEIGTKNTRVTAEMYEWIKWVAKAELTNSAQLLTEIAGKQLMARFDSHKPVIDRLKENERQTKLKREKQKRDRDRGGR